MTKKVSPKTSRGVRRGERLTNCSRDRCGRRYNAFTLIELLVVVSIIAVLGALVLSTAGYARKKGARARAETEIAAMSAACENYKADNGIYPRDAATTDALNAQNSGDPRASQYQNASLYLYNALFGATNGSRTPASGARSYFLFKPNMLFPADQTQNCTIHSGSIRVQLRLLDDSGSDARHYKRLQSDIRSVEHRWHNKRERPR